VLERCVRTDASLSGRCAAYVETDFAYLHKQRWNCVSDELRQRIEGAHGTERAEAERTLAEHRKTRFRPETSRAAILAAIEARTGMRVRADGGSLASAREVPGDENAADA